MLSLSEEKSEKVDERELGLELEGESDSGEESGGGNEVAIGIMRVGGEMIKFSRVGEGVVIVHLEIIANISSASSSSRFASRRS